MITTKICEHCLYYDHKCTLDNTDVSNVNSCKHWKPAVRYISRYRVPDFVEYPQYFIDK